MGLTENEMIGKLLRAKKKKQPSNKQKMKKKKTLTTETEKKDIISLETNQPHKSYVVINCTKQSFPRKKNNEKSQKVRSKKKGQKEENNKGFCFCFSPITSPQEESEESWGMWVEKQRKRKKNCSR